LSGIVLRKPRGALELPAVLCNNGLVEKQSNSIRRNPAMTTITAIEGIGNAFAQKLRKAGILTTEALLKQGATPKGRQELAKATGFNERTILEWVNRADMFRVRGIGPQYSDLLEAAGVDTVRELANRDPKMLAAALAMVNAKSNKTNRLPGLKQVRQWIKDSKSLPRVVEY
jgi:predicted flap endonuclease-1-like 5' DNA nuclease